MQTLQQSIDINAPKEKVWEVLWSTETFKNWAGIIDEGTYIQGDLKEGEEVNFIGNNDSGIRYGITSRIEKLIPNEYMLFTRINDIMVHNDGTIENREKQWAGGIESYHLEESNGNTKLTIIQDTPDELVEYFSSKIPLVLDRIKELSETK
jgi:uncharacterized protein YndB with AHSA1/START domain